MSASKASAAQQLVNYPVSMDHTGNRIRAFVASMTRDKGCSDDGRYERGRSLIERLALSAHGYGDPTLKLTQAQGADILAFMAVAQPLEPSTWWSDSPDGPSHLCGFMFVLRAVEGTLRKVARS